jgi:hypothetical protein
MSRRGAARNRNRNRNRNRAASQNEPLVWFPVSDIVMLVVVLASG